MMRKILILEDDMITQQLYRMLLKDKNIYVCFCATINEALINLMKVRFDLIISCLNIEERNCIQFLQLIHYWKAQTPLVLITGSENVREHISNIEDIVTSILFKPFQKEDFLQLIETHMQKKSTHIV